MARMRAMAPLAALMMAAACGGGADETGGAEGSDTAGTSTGTTVAPPAPAPPGTVDTAGVGTNPPTAGGQLVDSAAVPGPVDTTAGTTTAP